MKKHTRKALIILLLIVTAKNFTAQNIQLVNPSFEGIPEGNTLIEGWINCGVPKGVSLPDLHPNNISKVILPAQHGATYLGMVTRANESYDAVAQRLETPMKAGQCYKFSVYLAKSDSYLGDLSQNNNKQEIQAIRLRIIGANSVKGDTILGETFAITHNNWVKYRFRLKPKTDFTHIKLQVYYVTPTLFAYFGNVLIDNCSALKQIRCRKRLSKKKKKRKKPKQSKKPDTRIIKCY